MTVDYIVSSLPSLRFDEPPVLTWEKFLSLAGEDFELPKVWVDLETQLKNALCECRSGADFARPAEGCSLYWRNRVVQAYAEKDVMRRQDALDRVWWDAAGELTQVGSPLGKGALFTYAVRLKIALCRAKVSAETGSLAFEKCLKEGLK